MPDTLKLFLRGPQFDIYWLDRARSIDFKPQWDGMDREDKRKVLALLQRMADVGKIPNRQKFKSVEAGLWEFKSFQIRIPCLFHPERRRVLVLLHVFWKKQDEWKESDLVRARVDRDRVRGASFE